MTRTSGVSPKRRHRERATSETWIITCVCGCRSPEAQAPVALQQDALVSSESRVPKAGFRKPGPPPEAEGFTFLE